MTFYYMVFICCDKLIYILLRNLNSRIKILDSVLLAPEVVLFNKLLNPAII